MVENEKDILASSGLDNEIRELCQARDFAEAVLGEVPRGSCDYRLLKNQLKGIERRLEELGVDEVVTERQEIDNGLGRITTRRRITRWSPK